MSEVVQGLAGRTLPEATSKVPTVGGSGSTCDVLVVGGGILGTSLAYHLARRHGVKVILLEKRFLASGSTGRCICGVRQQFSHEATIRIAVESVRLFGRMEEELGRSVEWSSSGYLFLAHDEQRLRQYRQILPLQNRLGVPVTLLDPATVSHMVPKMSVEGLAGAAWCPTDGQANPFAVVRGYAEGARQWGAQVITGAGVVALDLASGGGAVWSVQTDDGRLYQAGVVVLAAGPHLAQVAKLAGVEVPVAPDRHEAIITEATERVLGPMLVDYRDGGCYFTQLAHTGQIIGCVTPTPAVPGTRTDSTLEFLGQVGRRMIRMMPCLRPVKVLRQWAGSYEMTPDGSPIVGPTGVDGLWVAGGMCGHGFMLGPAMGMLLAERIATGTSRIPLDDFALERDWGTAESLK